jgi:hypothetical protein
MKIASAILMSLICIQLFACSKDDVTTQTQNNGSGTTGNGNNNDTTSNKMKITIGSAVFTATLNNNATATAFKAMMPLTINMDELNGNEKFYYFSTTLPTNASAVGNIQVGDLMLYGNNCLVLFYEGFNTSYSYTRLGKIDNAAELVAALGAGSVRVKFEKQ